MPGTRPPGTLTVDEFGMGHRAWPSASLLGSIASRSNSASIFHSPSWFTSLLIVMARINVTTLRSHGDAT